MHPVNSLGRIGWAVSVLVVGACLAPSAVSAQGTEVTPFVGILLPLANTVDEDEFESKHKTGFGIGARLTHRFGGRLGLEGSAVYAWSDVEIDDPGFQESFGANVLALGAKVLYAVSAPEARTRIHVAAGPALVMRGGEFYDDLDLEGTTDVGVVVGAGLRVPIGERLGLSIQLEDFITSLKLTEGSQSTQSRLQNDVVVSVGLTIPLGGTR